MISFAVFALFLVFAVGSLVIWPILLHPTLPPARKWALSAIAALVIVPGGLLLYAWLGVPQMAVLN